MYNLYYIYCVVLKIQNRFGEDMAPIASDLPEEKRKQLCGLLGNVDLTLLYKASVHGYHNSAFHQRCDRQGPTVLVAYNRSGYIFGGYTSVEYAQSGKEITDGEAFLFSLRHGTPVRIKVNSYITRLDDTGGPNFGQQLYFCYRNKPVVYHNTDNLFFFLNEPINTLKLYGNVTQLTECEVYRVNQSKSIIRKKSIILSPVS